MERRKKKINSIQEFQKVVPLIVKAINADQQLGLRALANPLLAAEELGYEVAPEVQRAAQRRIRFTKETAERLNMLEKEIYSLSEERFDIDNPQELGKILFDKLKLQAPEVDQSHYQQRAASQWVNVEPLPPHIFDQPQLPDSLEVLREAHPVIAPLLEYRQLEASTPRLASREYYERIKRQEVKLPVTNVQVHLKRSRTLE